MNITKRWLASVLLVCAFLVAAGPVGCSKTTLSKDGVYQGDTFLYQAEKTITNADKDMSDFVAWERLHRAVLPVEVSKSADVIRLNQKKWIDSAHALRDAYVASPTVENKDKFQLALTLVRTALLEAVKYMDDNKSIAPNQGLSTSTK